MDGQRVGDRRGLGVPIPTNPLHGRAETLLRQSMLVKSLPKC